ncbi:MAG: hypothetical protein ACOC8K_00420 [Gemmatimonadota bacterium]
MGDASGRGDDPGAPAALPRTIRTVCERLGVAAVDRLWIFPPLRRGRREWGLVVASEFLESDERRRLHTARYLAEVTGRGLEYEVDVTGEGILPLDRFSRVLTGVARRAKEDLGDPRSVEIAGDSRALEDLLDELTPADVEAWQQ